MNDGRYIVNQVSCCETGKIKKTEAELDKVVIAIESELTRYERAVKSLIKSLESPESTENTKMALSEITPTPPTLGQSLGAICNRLIEATNALNETIKRIEEQVGELKILP